MAGLSKADYLKRYLSGPDLAEGDTKKKKKKKKKLAPGVKVKKVANMKIHDDDANDWARQSTAAQDEDAKSDDGIIDGAQVLRDQYSNAATIFDPDDMISMEKDDDAAQFRGKNTFTTVSGNDSDGNRSPPRGRTRVRHDSDSDGDTSPPRRQARHDSDSDASPPRSRQRHDSDSDVSPPRNRHDSDSDASPPRNRHDSDSDASPPRARRRGDDSDGDASPPRRSRGDDASPPRRMQDSQSGREKMEATVVSGGLVNAESLKAANVEKKARLKEEFARMAESGQFAETTHRDSSGKKLNPKLEKLKKRQEERKKQEEEEAKMKWGGPGLANALAKEEKMKEDLKTMAAPFARTKDDKDMNDMLKDQIHADDPMAAYMMKQKEKKLRGAGVKVKPKYKGPWPSNRYNIPPGHKWDGVDRSNGFEKRLFTAKNTARATAIDAHKWSTENM